MQALRVSEARALKVAWPFQATRILCTTLGRAQAALQLAQLWPQVEVVCWFLDLWQQELAAQEAVADNLSFCCQPDFHDQPIELAVIPTTMHGEAELTRDLLQAAYLRLTEGGTLVASTDNPEDDWLHKQLRHWRVKVKVERFPDAVVYVVRKLEPLRRVRDFRCEFKFRDRDHLISAVSRPGVFSHRHVDPGARQLIRAAEVSQGMRILDIGCGAGAVALALANRDPTVRVRAVDSNARAVECTRAGAKLNSLANVSVELNASGEYAEPGTFDLALANPPYFADFEIAERFVAAAHRSLRPGGQLLVVTKQPQWYAETLPANWQDVQIEERKRYFVASASK